MRAWDGGEAGPRRRPPSSCGTITTLEEAQRAKLDLVCRELGLRPGMRLLNHQIARRPGADEEAYRADPFTDAHVFPDGELAPAGRTVTILEEAGFEVRDPDSIREHCALTLRRVADLESDLPGAARSAGPGRARVWRLYMAAPALAFERNRIGVNRVPAARTPDSGACGIPLRTRDRR